MHRYDMTEVDYGGGGHRTRLKDQLINLCVHGVPPPPYIKGWRRGRAGPPMARPREVLLPPGVGSPLFLVEVGALPSRSRRGRKERGLAPFPIRIGLGGGARLPLFPSLSSIPLRTNKAQILPDEFL